MLVERIDGSLDDWNEAGNLEDFRVSVSIGIAEWHDGDTLDEMLDGADRKMYEQKSS
jgi:GGDEF domain-containing protein